LDQPLRENRPALALVAILALAAGERHAAAEWQVSAYVGAAASAAPSLRLVQPERSTNLEFTGVTWRGESFRSPLYYGYRVGWFRRRDAHVGVEIEFTHLKAFANTEHVVQARGTLAGTPVDEQQPLGTVIGRLSMSHGLNLLTVGVTYRRAIVGGDDPCRGLWLALRGGGGPTIPHAESRIGADVQQQYAWGRFVGQVGAGVEWRLGLRWSWLGEYKWTRTAQRLGVPAGTIESTIRSHHVVTGVGWRF
jgi:lipid A oxidase